MKKIQFGIMLVTVMLLACGLFIGCDTGNGDGGDSTVAPGANWEPSENQPPKPSTPGAIWTEDPNLSIENYASILGRLLGTGASVDRNRVIVTEDISITQDLFVFAGVELIVRDALLTINGGNQLIVYSGGTLTLDRDGQIDVNTDGALFIYGEYTIGTTTTAGYFNVGGRDSFIVIE